MYDDRTSIGNFTVRGLIAVLAAGVMLQASSAYAVQYTTTRYVRINHADHSAYIYDENFVRLPDSPGIPLTSADYITGAQWFLGADIGMVLRLPDGTVQDVSSDPTYTEMNHHFVVEYVNPARPATDPCGLHRPLVTGSELTNFHFPAGYGYKMDGGYLQGWSWHWTNPAGIPLGDEIYISYVLHWDDSPTGYTDTQVTWVDAVPCTSELCIPPGQSTYSGADYPVSVPLRIVMVLPHVHDHVDSFELRLNGAKLHGFVPNNANTPVAHDDCGQGVTPWHQTPAHLPVGGLSPWTPGAYGPIINDPSAKLSTFSTFNNPHSVSIDNMVIMITFWELNPSGSPVPADFDFDGDVDGNDFLTFSNCSNGALNPPKPSCANGDADLDLDGDVDGNDFLTFSNCFNGSLNPPACL